MQCLQIVSAGSSLRSCQLVKDKHYTKIESICRRQIKSLSNDKISDWSKLKAFADDKIDVPKKLKFVLGRVENIEGKGENAGNQHFLLFPQCFQKRFFLRVVKSRDCVVKS